MDGLSVLMNSYSPEMIQDVEVTVMQSSTRKGPARKPQVDQEPTPPYISMAPHCGSKRVSLSLLYLRRQLSHGQLDLQVTHQSKYVED